MKSNFQKCDFPAFLWTEERLDGPLNLAGSGISSINMALEINGVVYTGMGLIGCLYWHEVGIYSGMGILDFLYEHEVQGYLSLHGGLEYCYTKTG